MAKVIRASLKGYRRGERHPQAKLTDSQAEEVLDLSEAGVCYRVIAARFGVSKSCIAGICQFRRRHVTLCAP